MMIIKLKATIMMIIINRWGDCAVSTTSACQTESIEVKIQDGNGENVFNGEYDDGFDGEYYNGFDGEYDDGFDGDKYADDENEVENLSCQAAPRAANRAPSRSATLGFGKAHDYD